MAHARSASYSSPAVVRRELADRLRRLRLDAGLTIDDVAARLLVSPSKISRLETGQRPAGMRDVRDLAGLYGVPATEVSSLLTLTQNSRQPSHWQQYGTFVSDYAELEQASTAIAQYMTSTIPARLQTEAYAEAVTSGARTDITDDEREKWVRARLLRQEFLQRRPDPPQTAYVLDEASLLRVVGGSDVMKEQLEALAMHAGLPYVSLRVISLDSGAHPGMDEEFEILSLPDVADVVYLEGLAGTFYLRKPGDLDRYHAVFSKLTERALDTDASAALIVAHARRLSEA